MRPWYSAPQANGRESRDMACSGMDANPVIVLMGVSR